MDRTEEFFRVAKSIQESSCIDIESKSNNDDLSDFMKISYRISSNLSDNESWINRMEKLISRKDFSNDPTEAMNEICNVIQKKITSIQADIKRVNDILSSITYSASRQQQQYYNIIIQAFNKNLSKQVDLYKNSLKAHTEHLKQRNQRVSKYGTGNSQLRESSIFVKDAVQSYAMFNTKPMVNTKSNISMKSNENGNDETILGSKDNNQVRRRAANMKSNSNASIYTTPDSYGSNSSQHNQKTPTYLPKGGYVEQLMLSKDKVDYSQRLKDTHKVEAMVAQMGELFTSLASLVMEQSETITRIEDDVEIGLTNTIEANESMQKLDSITKGNRSMIIKIFLLIIFFIFLFLVWT